MINHAPTVAFSPLSDTWLSLMGGDTRNVRFLHAPISSDGEAMLSLKIEGEEAKPSKRHFP